MAVIYEELQARLRAVARPEEDPDALIEAAVQEFIARRAAEAARWDAARAEARAVLHGPRRPSDPEAAYQKSREKYGWREDLSPLTEEALADRYEAGLDALPADQAAEGAARGPAMTASFEEPSPRYVVVESDRYDADRDRAILSVYRLLGPERANEWAKGLARASFGLTGFPGPLSHARDEEASALYRVEVRRLLYYGPTRRRTGTPARLLFTLLPPAEDDPDPNPETTIHLLRLLSGPQALLPPDPPETL